MCATLLAPSELILYSTLVWRKSRGTQLLEKGYWCESNVKANNAHNLAVMFDDDCFKLYK